MQNRTGNIFWNVSKLRSCRERGVEYEPSEKQREGVFELMNSRETTQKRRIENVNVFNSPFLGGFPAVHKLENSFALFFARFILDPSFSAASQFANVPENISSAILHSLYTLL